MGIAQGLNPPRKAAFRYKAFPRVKLPIRLTPLGDDALLSSDVFDISISGVSIILSAHDAVPSVGQGVKIDLTLMDAARISCIGKVARTQKIESHMVPQMKVGIQFYDLPVRYRLAIKKAIDKAVAFDREVLQKDLSIAIREKALLASNVKRSAVIYDTPVETSYKDVMKIGALFLCLAIGIYFMDRYSGKFSSKPDSPDWASNVFRMRAMETGKFVTPATATTRESASDSKPNDSNQK